MGGGGAPVWYGIVVSRAGKDDGSDDNKEETGQRRGAEGWA